MPRALAPGEKLSRAFDLRSSLLKLRVVASDGVTPLSGITLVFDVPKSSWSVHAKPTDAEGMVEVEGLPAIPIPVLVWPKELSTNEARAEFFRSHKGRMEDVLVRVRTITVTPPEAIATIVLPASAGY